MATIQSPIITAALSSSYSPADVRAVHGRVRRKVAVFDATKLTAAGIALNDVLEICKLKASSSIVDIRIKHSAFAASSTLDLGIRTPSTSVGGTPASLSKDDVLVDGFDVNAATAVPTSCLGFGTNGMTADKMGLPLWQQAGVTTEPTPGTEYAITGIAGGADWITSGTDVLCIDVLYTAGD